MAISGKSGYLATIDAFLTHWTEVNTALGAEGPLTVRLEGGTTVTRAQLLAMRTGIDAALTELQGKLVDEALARGALDLKKGEILTKAQEFGRKVRADYAGTPSMRALPELPKADLGRELFTRPMRSVATLWPKINALPSGLLELSNGIGVGDFETLVTELGTAWTAVEAAEMMAGIARSERDDLLEPVLPVLSGYQAKVKALFPPGHALVESLPKIYPAAGHTPEPVNAAGSWDAVAQTGKLTWDASADAELDHYEVRYSPGTEYDSEAESVVANLAPNAPREALTLQGLGTPGSTSLFRVYVVLTTGNERGSETVAISRP